MVELILKWWQSGLHSLSFFTSRLQVNMVCFLLNHHHHLYSHMPHWFLVLISASLWFCCLALSDIHLFNKYLLNIHYALEARDVVMRETDIGPDVLDLHLEPSTWITNKCDFAPHFSDSIWCSGRFLETNLHNHVTGFLGTTSRWCTPTGWPFSELTFPWPSEHCLFLTSWCQCFAWQLGQPAIVYLSRK